MKRGSALLVVLGMVAFMVVSAVAFSAYMRASRLPNSYLRRASASRLLAKAAVAAAIDQVDAAIGNNPHPGLGTRQPRPNAGLTTSGSAGSEDLRTRNHWTHRVYIGTNQFHATSETISPLCVEALAYIPPPLVNEARYYSRRSDAAVWRRLGFDSGRYVFCALDVSDYFDVNALAANVGRGASPATRLSLAYLCEDKDHTRYDIQPRVWDDFMEDIRGTSAAEQEVNSAGSTSGGASAADPNKVPLVSVADLNLALWDKKPGDFTSYFGQYFDPKGSGGSGNGFYAGAKADSAAGEKVKRMTFVTDGYYPPSAEGSGSEGGEDSKDYDLADETYQPFTRNQLKNSGTVLRVPLLHTSDTAKRLAKGLSRIGLALLWDYLDTDNVPLSLALPSVERVPMVVGVNHTLNGTLKVDATVVTDGNPADDAYEHKKDVTPPTAAAEGTRTVARVRQFKLVGSDFRSGVYPGVVEATVAYPFRRGVDTEGLDDAFKIDGHLALFFASESMGLRATSAGALRLNGGTAFIDETSVQNGVFHFKLDEQPLNFSQVTKKEEAVKTVQLVARQNASLMTTLANEPLLTVVEVWSQTAPKLDPDTGVTTPTWAPAEPPGGSIVASADGFSTVNAKTHCAYPALLATGEVDPTFSDDNQLVGYLNGSAGKSFTLHAATWLRIRNGDDKTVDLVPAHLADDGNFNSVNNTSVMPLLRDVSGADFPLMRFAGASFAFNLTDLANVNQAFGFAPAGVMCSDPRWNWAPEHWWKVDSAVTATDWLANCQVGQGNRDRDIFMMTSDAGYMQSVYELAMLPRVTDSLATYGVNGGSEVGGLIALTPTPTDWLTSFADTRNSGLMWRTYCPYARNGVTRDAFENVGVNDNTGRIVCEGGGTKICPYSDSTNVMMAAFANAPTDWWTAAAQAESDVGVAVNTRKNAQRFNEKYAFNAFTEQPISKFGWEDLREVAENFMESVRGANDANVDWEACFNDLDWNGDTSAFCGSDLPDSTARGLDLSDVDRRFLYGYWRECFAARQQLFLVFVRAEPLMMGGGASRQVPPQLGVRAMALVWRDPTPAVDEQTPHRTRVLFYRQFE